MSPAIYYETWLLTTYLRKPLRQTRISLGLLLRNTSLGVFLNRQKKYHFVEITSRIKSYLVRSIIMYYCIIIVLLFLNDLLHKPKKMNRKI
jgi:hypothetical protein